MIVENLPDLNPPAFGGINDPRRPILSFAWRTDQPYRIAAHRHARGHIIQPIAGALWATTPEGNWLVPAGQAIWIPSRVFHEIYSHGALAARMLFVDESCALSLPPHSLTVKVSALLSELIGRAIAYGNAYPGESPAARLALVILDELTSMERAPLLIPVSKDPRLARVMEALIADPASLDSIEHAARQAGASQRTIARLFRTETGMTFTQWKTRLRLVHAIDRLARGHSVTETAVALGYGTVSAFTFMFRGNLGVSPGAYRLQR